MKICLLCGATSALDAATCRNDGEASWSPPIGARVPASPKNRRRPSSRAAPRDRAHAMAKPVKRRSRQ